MHLFEIKKHKLNLFLFYFELWQQERKEVQEWLMIKAKLLICMYQEDAITLIRS